MIALVSNDGHRNSVHNVGAGMEIVTNIASLTVDSCRTSLKCMAT